MLISHTPSLFIFWLFFWHMVLHFCPGPALNCDPPTDAKCVVAIGMSHYPDVLVGLGLTNICLGWPQTMILQISNS
jgi:hypothetical protein